LRCIDPRTGAAVWHLGGTTPDGRRRFGRTISSCAVHDGLVYAPDVAGVLHCLDAGTGKQHWEFDLKSPVWASPLWADGKVYLGTTDGDVYVFRHGKTASVAAKVEMGEPIHCPMAAANGTIYIVTASHLFAIARPR